MGHLKEEYANSAPAGGEPVSRWRRHIGRAVDFVQSEAIADKDVVMIGEVQLVVSGPRRRGEGSAPSLQHSPQ